MAESSPTDPQTPKGRGFLSVCAELLRIRKPTRLIIDGLICLAAFTILTEVSRAFAYETTAEAYRDMAIATRLVLPTTLLNILATVLYYTGFGVMAAGCARLAGTRSDAPAVQT